MLRNPKELLKRIGKKIKGACSSAKLKDFLYFVKVEILIMCFLCFFILLFLPAHDLGTVLNTKVQHTNGAQIQSKFMN